MKAAGSLASRLTWYGSPVPRFHLALSSKHLFSCKFFRQSRTLPREALAPNLNGSAAVGLTLCLEVCAPLSDAEMGVDSQSHARFRG